MSLRILPLEYLCDFEYVEFLCFLFFSPNAKNEAELGESLFLFFQPGSFGRLNSRITYLSWAELLQICKSFDLRKNSNTTIHQSVVKLSQRQVLSYNVVHWALPFTLMPSRLSALNFLLGSLQMPYICVHVYNSSICIAIFF